jgi:hypothetical protein
MMKRIVLLSVAALFALSPLASPSAQAAGCVKGAIVGGIAGHSLGHHGLLGAGAGCVIAHHEAAKRDREQGYRY